MDVFYTLVYSEATLLPTYLGHTGTTIHYDEDNQVELIIVYVVVHREILMGVGNGVASVIMLTFTKMPAPHADFYKDARPPC